MRWRASNRDGFRRARHGVGITAVAVVASGLLVNVMLAVVARSVSTPEYAVFSAFWSVALVAGFGVFLPIEQWLATRQDSPESFGGDITHASRLVAVMVGVEVVVVLCTVGTALWPRGGQWGMLGALAVLCVASGVQFLVRGALIALRRMDLYAAVLTLDIIIRLVLA